MKSHEIAFERVYDSTYEIVVREKETQKVIRVIPPETEIPEDKRHTARIKPPPVIRVTMDFSQAAAQVDKKQAREVSESAVPDRLQEEENSITPVLDRPQQEEEANNG